MAVQLSPLYDADGTVVPVASNAAHAAALVLLVMVKDVNVDNELSTCSTPRLYWLATELE